MTYAALADADILNTRHNFLPSRVGGRDSAKEVCVFCHAPTLLEGDSQPEMPFALAMPRWQKSVRHGQFDMFDDFGRGSSGQAAGSVSVACLSCHDNNQAFGVNQESMADHPFGVPYRGFRMDKALRQIERERRIELAATFREAVSDISSFEFRAVQTAISNKRRFWWTSLDANASVKTKNDITFTPRTIAVGDTQIDVPYVECSSCHDPHAEKRLFLRVENGGSRVCLSCHIK